MSEENGAVKTLPALVIGFDQATQQVHLKFDPEQFRSWDFILGLLEMAKINAQHMRLLAMQQQAMQQAQNQQIVNQIMRR